ncbi:SDR family NAD(P)-dependent oxidoreductase [Hydrogenophaga intermedia]|uniref:Short-chain dehydrogenase/reductase SDR n=1 Tax=Hydrogenophaga intermedia TaxID=65786 RepID=A0A1L1PUB6_HYDIT|nr:SDR family NAD(P)-dependent oxidoreductase [Hydrogenophaga intermedia]TMU72287.1 SDR family oxidoreductase [Hydrogenophaga intermedia]CDN90497.1 Short-chain dehydrogenase/reductase SDR [Hydrogenophaga intermedia]
MPSSPLLPPPDQRVAIVTGAADGIGWATAQRLAQEYGHVVVADLRPEAAEARARELGAGHGWQACDVTQEGPVRALVQDTVARFGRLDVLVNNAGIGEQPVMTLEQTVEGFDRILAVHLRGTFLASREAGRVFVLQQSGAIVNIASIAGRQGHPGRNAYGAAKAGISTMTEAMASEWARDGIRVNAVAPGYVMTELVKELVAKGALDMQSIEDNTPMGRCGAPEEIAEAIAFLASERAAYITGVTLPVDGGWLGFGAPPAKLGTVEHKRVVL